MQNRLSDPALTEAGEYVVLLDEAGQPVGRRLKAEVHTDATPLHLAFSVYVTDVQDRVLMTRRSLGKQTWPGVWTNSCCGHPAPGEDMTDAIRRRLWAELGVRGTELVSVLPDFAYRAQDAGGIWENEICPVFTTRLAPEDTVQLDPDESMDQAWVSWPELSTAMVLTPFAFSPWSVTQVGQLTT